MLARGEGRQNLTSTLKAAGVVAIRSSDNHELSVLGNFLPTRLCERDNM